MNQSVNPSGRNIHTFTGRNVDPYRLEVADIDILDIAHSLAMQCRFNGHIPHFYSVAEHCVELTRRLPDNLKAWGLLHDAGEAYLGDVVSPLKASLPVYQELEKSVLSLIARRFGLEWPIPEPVLNGDLVLLEEEKEAFFGTHSANGAFQCLSPREAKEQYQESASRWLK